MLAEFRARAANKLYWPYSQFWAVYRATVQSLWESKEVKQLGQRYRVWENWWQKDRDMYKVRLLYLVGLNFFLGSTWSWVYFLVITHSMLELCVHCGDNSGINFCIHRRADIHTYKYANVDGNFQCKCYHLNWMSITSCPFFLFLPF